MKHHGSHLLPARKTFSSIAPVWAHSDYNNSIFLWSDMRALGTNGIFAMLILAATAVNAQVQSTLSGRLLSNQGLPVAGAEVSVAGTLQAARSDSTGRFVVAALPAGRIRVQARALGFSPVDTVLTLAPGETYSATLIMVRNVQQLAPVMSEATLPYGKPLRYQHTSRFDAFYERRAKRPGAYFTREDIELSGRHSAMDLISTVPGVRLNWRNGSAIVRVARCEATSIYGAPRPTGESGHRWLAVFINGQRIGEDAGIAIETLAQMKADEIETMEVYRGASQLPMEAVGNACAAVFITTRFTTGSVLTNK